MDGIQQLRLMFGVAKDLKQSKQWNSFLTNSVKVDALVLAPMQQVGLLIDSQRLLEFQARLKQYEARVFGKIQTIIHTEVKPLVPRGGWKRFPSGHPPEEVITQEVEVEVLVCTLCGEEGVPHTHNCEIL